MPKQIDYPRANLKNSLQLVSAVDDLGGKCSEEMAADKLNKKVSGAFRAQIAAAVKFGLLLSKSGQLETTQLYRDYKLAYSKEEGDKVLVEAFLSPPLFRAIFDRFCDRELPLSHFEKLLIREFKVPEGYSSRVAKYFIEGAKQCGLIGPGNVLLANKLGQDEDSGDEFDDDEEEESSPKSLPPPKNTPSNMPRELPADTYSVTIMGPGMNSTIVVHEPEDLLIVQAMLKKVEKKVSESGEMDK